jgi:hypothetical protein
MPSFINAFLFLCLTGSVIAADWPMWRADAGRTASSPQALPEPMHLLWKKALPPVRPAFREQRLQFDRGYEPVVAGKTLLVGSSREDAVIALDTETGEEKWRALAAGPVRFAPVIEGDRVLFGADDGVMRCVSLADGALIWEKRAVPSLRKLLGNQRLISVWPIRGGPVVQEGRVYFAAGVWPLEGVFVFCWEVATGEQVWCNDRCSYLYGIHPHETEAMGGLAPQGYLLIDAGDLIVPCSTAYPARFDLKSGALKQFELPSAGRLTGGWFASTPAEKEALKLKRRGLLFDEAVSTKRHEDKPRAEGLAGIRRSLHAAEREWSFDHPWPDLVGKPHSVVVADDKCFVMSEDGVLHAYGSRAAAKKESVVRRRVILPSSGQTERARKWIEAAGTERGYAILSEAGEPGWINDLAAQSQYHLIVITTDPALRDRLTKHRLYGERVAVIDSAEGLPPYFASVIFGDKVIGNALRPNGGRLVSLTGEVLQIRGALEGSTNYLADWQSSDDPLVKAPLGVLWFDDALSNFKRSPQPKVVEGVMITSDKDWLDATHRKGKVDYRLQAPVFSDIYTGRVLDEYEAPQLRRRYGKVDQESIQLAQYRPPTQTNDWKPGAPQPGSRINPLTGEQEPRLFPKSYGCDGGFDYGGIYTFRSGTAAFYDKRVESGTVHISGPRSGCTNSIVPAGGILNVPYYYEGCTCSYPLPTALALYSQPETFEQWATWGPVPAADLHGKIKRIGLNFGAPGDRKTEDGTLWLDHPNVGGPSPELEIETVPAELATFYRHSLWMKGGEGWPWVAASGVKGLQSLTLAGLKNGRYSVRLTFAAPTVGEHRFDVTLQGQPVLRGVQPKLMQAETRTVSPVQVEAGSLTLTLIADQGKTLLSGVELIRED